MFEELVLPHPGTAWVLKTFRTGDGDVRLVSAGPEAICVWDPATSAPTATLDDLSWPMNDIEVCRPAERDPVLAVGTDFGVEWFDAITGNRCYGQTTGDTIWSLAAASMPDGTETLFSTGYLSPFPIHRWDTATGSMQPDLGRHDDHIVTVAVLTLHNGASMIAATGWSHTIHRWNPETGTELGPPMVGLPDIVHSMGTVTLPDGRILLISGDSGGEVCRWDAVTGEQVGNSIKAHDEMATVVTMATRNGPQFLTSGMDQVVRRWDAISGKLLDEPTTGYNPVLLEVSGTLAVATAGPEGLYVRPFSVA